MQKILTTT